MVGMGNIAENAASAPSLFATTHWSVVLAAGQRDSPQSATALEQLCRGYWYPLYAYVRRRGHKPEDAQDLTQEFFARLLAREYLRRADPARGKFRTFLLTALNGFLCDEWDKAGRQKRGGHRPMISFDGPTAEDRYRLEPMDESTPERLYERAWALSLLERAAGRLRDEYASVGRAELYAQLTDFRLDGAADCSYATAAARLGLSESAVKSAIHRLRERHQQLVLEEIANTLADPAELEAEVRYLLRVVGG
jgi:RNA polymerase sigma-70 factor (ECF subfamily)